MRTENFDDFTPRDYNPTDFQIGPIEVIVRPKRAPEDNATATDICQQLRLIGNALASKYDLSKATARIISKGTKGFVAHRFTSLSGDPKVGGAQFSGEFKLDRYVSYRIRDDIYALSAVATWDDPAGAVRFQVFAPKSQMRKGWKSFENLRPGIRADLVPKLKVGGCEHTDIFLAWKQLDELLSKVAVKRVGHASLL